jgi:hypothetical protein
VSYFHSISRCRGRGIIIIRWFMVGAGHHHSEFGWRYHRGDGL